MVDGEQFAIAIVFGYAGFLAGHALTLRAARSRARLERDHLAGILGSVVRILSAGSVTGAVLVLESTVGELKKPEAEA